MRLKQESLDQQFLTIRSKGETPIEQTQKEAKMHTLQSQQMWDMMRAHQAEMLKEVQRDHLARMAQQPQTGWWTTLFRRQEQSPSRVLETSTTPELG